jgi:hypothetical protein
MQSSRRGFARPSRREPILVLVLALAAGAILAAGCGDDTTAPVFPRDEVIVDIRDGHWDLEDITTIVGCDTSAAPADTASVDSLALCSLNFTTPGVNPQLVLGVECESFVDDGTAFSFACNVGLNLDPCIVDMRVEGSGTRDSLSFAYEVRSWTAGLTGPVNPCDIYANSCTTVVRVTGTYHSPPTGPCRLGEIPDAAAAALRTLGFDPGS